MPVCALLLLLALPLALSSQADSREAEALLRAAHQEYGRKNWAEAARRLRQAAPRLPLVADHVAFLLASAEYELHDHAAAIRALELVWNAPLPSPHTGEAALLAARAHLAMHAPREAVRLLRQHEARLGQPAGDALLATALEAAGERAPAARHFQQVYYQYPASPEAEAAGSALTRLRSALGSAYPAPSASVLLLRPERWLRAGQPRRARAEYLALVSRLSGAERELARVRIGAADYAAGRNTAAHSHLKSLELASPDAEAERLYWQAECARRLERDDELLRLLERLGTSHPQSSWRLKALVSAGNRYLIQNRPDSHERLYRACCEGFPTEPQAAYCHWKVVWSAYLQRRPEAPALLRAHLQEYPGSEKADAALYFLGRLAEAAREPGVAKAYYAEAAARFAIHYYAALAQDRLAQTELLAVAPSSEVTEGLRRLAWPVRRALESFEPAPVSRQRLARARLLYAAGIDALAEKELRFGARTDSQAHLLAMELAEAAARRGAHAQALRFMKGLAPGYLDLPLASAPETFWRLLFPLPYRAELERYAKWRDLDPFLLAGLIRQESEFDPRAVSAARAYGLTQILPATGRLLARKLGQRFRTSLLFQPDYNLRLGTHHLRTLFEKHASDWVMTLAAYNAGSTRVENWVSWGTFREPAEFVETIPFTETRNYVLAVLRNARLYRRLYGAQQPSAADRRPSP